MACRINGNTVRTGLTNFLDKELVGSTMFRKQDDVYVVTTPQYFAAQEFVQGLNSKFTDEVVRKLSDRRYEITIPDTLVQQYINSTDEGQELSTMVGLFGDFAISPESWNEDQTFQALSYPEVSEMTYNNLVSFLKTLNPNFRVEEVDNLDVDGLTSMKDFLIKVKNQAKFSAMPEEVAHAYFELIPEDNTMKKDMLDNIVNYPIYSQTLSRYKEVYLTPDGQPDYNKIKREAAAKLIAEYVTAIANDNYTRVNELGKARQSWFQRWFYKFMEWLGLGILNNTNYYADIAGNILAGKNDISLKTEEDLGDISFTDSYFYRLSEKQRYENAYEIVTKNPPKLLENISRFSKEFGRRFNEVLKAPEYADLNEMLKRNGNTVGKINRMSEIQIVLSEAGIDLRSALDSSSFLTGVKQYLEAIDSLDIVSDAILKVVQKKQDAENFDQAIQNIKELEGYFGIYETFNNLISAELAQILIDANVAPDVIESIQRTQTSFKNVNDHVLSKIRQNLFVFYREMLRESNNVAAVTLAEDIARLPDNPKAQKLFKESLDKLITNDDTIIKMLSGKGKDIDNFSSINHLINASHTNGDVFLSSISRYVQNKVEVAQNKARADLLSLYDRINPIQKQLNEDAVATGRKITTIDTVTDRETGETRQILVWQNPHRGITVALEGHRRRLREAMEAFEGLDKNSQEYKDAQARLRETKAEYNEFLEKYMNRPFVKEYYNFRQKYEDNEVFNSAMAEWRRLSDQIKDDEGYLSVLDNEQQSSDAWEQLSVHKRERANLLNEYDMEGQLKPEEELKEVRALKEYFEESSKFKEEDEVQTERTYQIFRNRYEQKVDFNIAEARNQGLKDIFAVEEYLQVNMKEPRLRITTLYLDQYDEDKPVNYDFVKDIVMVKWQNRNITKARNEEFYEFEADLFKQLEELQNKGELTEVEQDLKKAYGAVRSLLFGTRDEIGHINPSTLSEEERSMIIQLEDIIEDLKAERPGMTLNLEDFSDVDRQRYEDLGKVMNDPDVSDGRKRNVMRERSQLVRKYKNIGKNKAIRDLINILGSITEKVPTTYYWDRMQPLIYHMAEFGKYINSQDLTKEAKKEMNDFVRDFTETIDTENWDRLQFVIYEKEIFEFFLDWLKENQYSQYQWFIQNHLQKSVYDNENGAFVKLKYVRSAIYNHTLPVLPEHTIEQKNRRFRKFRVKDEYRTGYNPETKKVELQVGRHITNREYNGFPEFMPLLPQDGEPANSPYRNQEYYNLQANDPVRFQYLQELRNAHLAMQEKLPSRLRSWNAVPVMDLSNIESWHPDNLKAEAKQKIEFIKSIRKSNESGDALAQAEGLDTVKEIDQFTQLTINERIPKLGMAQKIPIDNVSRNLLQSVGQMIFRSYEFEGRVQAEPVVKSLIRVMKDNEFKNRMSNKERAKKFESIYSQMILEEVPETTLNSRAVRRIAKFITANTALRMVADPIGGIINYTSAMINNTIEAAAGKYLNFQDLARGKALAFRVNRNLMNDFNRKAGLSVDTLLFDTFDFIQGDFEQDLLERSSSKNKKSMVRQLLMVPRKAGELMAQTAIGMGILDRHKVENSLDGKKYPVHQIYKIQNNNLVLKEGFPEEYNPIDGAQFLKLKRLINRVNLELHGNYAKISQSEASRYAIGKLAENMKRWFMPAFQRRFGRETIDITYEDINEGYYRTSYDALRNIFGNLFRMNFGDAKSWWDLYSKTPRYRQNLSRMGAELAIVLLLFTTFSLLLGYSGDDKNKELENNSWIHNTMLLITLRAYSETTAYIPFPAFGLQELKRNALSPFSLPADAISNYAAIIQLGLYQIAYWLGADGFEKNLYYSKDSGYWFSEAGDSKLMKYVLNTFGHSGYTINPDQYIKQFESLQGRLK